MSALLDVFEELSLDGDPDTEVTGVCLDSRRVQPGDLYVALAGATSHGANYTEQAFAAGAVAVLTDSEVTLFRGEGPHLTAHDPRSLLGRLSAAIYDNPAEKLTTIGITGTQGKTTTSRLLEGALEASGVPTGVIGTIGTRINGVDVKTSLTTPEAPDLHGLFARMVEDGVRVCVMEVSSHALVMGRVDGVVFDVAVFLNLGRDHLDFHHTVEEYFQAKASLFTPLRAKQSVINLDDEYGRRLSLETSIPTTTYGAKIQQADWTFEIVDRDPGETIFELSRRWHRTRVITVPMPGDYNASNAAAALLAAAAAGLNWRDVARGLATGRGVPGRLEEIENGAGIQVIVDYAHKPDAVEAAIATMRPLARRVLVVIGAGGDRDTGKRPIMGEIAARLADVVVVTDDNPRSEEPAAIRAQVLAGTAAQDAEVHEIGDRRAAITYAIKAAGPGDVVLILGKGHETGQEIAGVIHPFDDRDVARDVLRAL
ncbi:MAG TPA: UDP-N-acetylmuramoyl-L-alanyl-D-glutamate--2,6-diaminopimelate ligase [Nocardioides sp.]|nr:UDP-N-acetylmuramoyl-L-alanyl-D-glutamate--2,6-diaminopimelate ligase [Nocardioides sp.]